MAQLSIEQVHALHQLPDDVSAAFARAEEVDFQAGADWYSLLTATAVSTGERICVSVLRRNGAFAAALPLLISAGGRAGEVRSLTNFYATRYTPALAAGLQPGELAALLRSVRARPLRASHLYLSPLDRNSQAYEQLRTAMRQAGFLTFDYFCFGNWYLPVVGSCDAYLAARPGEVRSTLKRASRRLSQAGGHIEMVDATGNIEPAIAAWTSIYAMSWKQAEPFPHFMPELIRLCARRGWLRMAIVWLGDKPIAAQVWVVAHGKASIFKLAYDSAHAKLSPGSLLTAALMRQAIDVDKVAEIDYLTGDDPYKQDWMTHRRELWGLVGYDPRQFGGARRALRELAARGAKRVLGAVRGQPRPSASAAQQPAAGQPLG